MFSFVFVRASFSILWYFSYTHLYVECILLTQSITFYFEYKIQWSGAMSVWAGFCVSHSAQTYEASTSIRTKTSFIRLKARSFPVEKWFKCEVNVRQCTLCVFASMLCGMCDVRARSAYWAICCSFYACMFFSDEECLVGNLCQITRGALHFFLLTVSVVCTRILAVCLYPLGDYVMLTPLIWA